MRIIAHPSPKTTPPLFAGGEKMGISMRGATGAGDGVHVLTGPIHMCGAEKGDVLQVSAAPGVTSHLSPQSPVTARCQ